MRALQKGARPFLSPLASLPLVSGEGFAQLFHRPRLLFVREDDLAREHDGHRPGRLAQEIVDGLAETRLRVLDGGREVGADLRRAYDSEGGDGVAHEAARRNEP